MSPQKVARMHFVYEEKLTLLDSDPPPLVPVKKEDWDYDSVEKIIPVDMYEYFYEEEDEEDINLNLIEVGIGRNLLVSFLKCACGQFPGYDYTTCISGHYICTDCLSKTKPFYLCPHKNDQIDQDDADSGFCGERIIESKCGIMDEFLDTARIPCPYANKGCEKMLIGLENAEHRGQCFYRPLYLCLDKNCDADFGKMCETDMLTHLMTTHGIKMYNDDAKDVNGYALVPFRFPKQQDLNYEDLVMTDRLDIDYQAVVERQPGLIFSFDESNFLLILERVLDEVLFRVLILNKEEGKEYIYHLKVLTNEGDAQIREGDVRGITGASFSDMEEPNEGLYILTQAIEERYLCSTLDVDDMDRVLVNDKDKEKSQFLRIKFEIEVKEIDLNADSMEKDFQRLVPGDAI